MKKVFCVMMLAVLAADASAQIGRSLAKTRSSSQLAQDSAEAAAKLGSAQKNTEVEQGRLNDSRSRENTMADKATKAAAELQRAPDPVEAATSRRANASMRTALGNVSEEGKMLLAQSAARGPTSAPPKPELIKSDSDAGSAVPSSGGAGPKPGQMKPVSLENPGVPGSKIIITCTGAAFFDSEKSIAIFTENVEVRHPQFFVSCDEFEVHMVKDEKPKDGEAPKSGEPIKPGTAIKVSDPISAPPEKAKPAPAAGGGAAPGGGMAGADSSIKFAIARGRMVTIEKLTETGEIQVGHSKHATYEGATGNILMRDFPQVQRGQHLQIATDPSTTMLLKQNGALDTKGPSRTEIVQEDKAKANSKLNSPPPTPTASPNPSASPTTSPRPQRQ